MLPLRYVTCWRLAGIAILSIVLCATIMPALWSWSLDEEILLLDKWLHTLTFLFLSLWFAGQYERNSYWRLFVGLVAFGALIELGQSMISYRSAEWMDILADVCGITAGLVIAFAGLGGWSMRVEQWLEKEKVTID